jgi:hypothetical protein
VLRSKNFVQSGKTRETIVTGMCPRLACRSVGTRKDRHRSSSSVILVVWYEDAGMLFGG